MTPLKSSVQRLLAGLASLGIVSGWGAGMGAVAIVSATPAAACNYEGSIGTVCTVAFDWCPQNYLKADGQVLAIREYQALFSLLGNRFGGDGINSFGVPDLRGRSVIGWGQGLGLKPVQIAEKVGKNDVKLDQSQVPVREHTHGAVFNGTQGPATRINVPASAGSLGVTSKLKAVQAPGVAMPQTGSYLGMGGSGVQAASIYVPSTSTATPVDLGGLDVQLTGTAGHGPIGFDIPPGIIGGTITVTPTQIPAIAAVPTQSPGLGLTVCIAVNGDFPRRP